MRLRTLHRSAHGVLLLALALSQGCFVPRRVAPDDLDAGHRILLASDSGFGIRQVAAMPAAPALEGRAWRLTAELAHAGGDTLTLRNIRFMGRHDLSTEWRLREPAIVVLGENTNLHPESFRFSPVRTAAFVVVVPVVTFAVVFAMRCQSAEVTLGC